MKSLILRTICIFICFSMMLVLVNTVLAKEKIDCFTFTNEITVDGKWTSSDEWDDSVEEILSFGNGSGDAYLRIKHDVENLYVLIDFVTYNDVKTGDGCVVILDTENDGGSSIKSDDLSVVIRWNSPNNIFTGIQWEGWWNEWENLPVDFEADSSTEAEYDLYSTNPHLVFEFKIPKSNFKSSSSTLGFIVFLICDNENLTAAFPFIQDAYNPNNWADLIFFNETIQLYKNVQDNIDEANTAIINAKAEGRTEGLKQAETFLEQAEEAQEEHSYNEAINLAKQAKESAGFASIPIKSNSDETPSFDIIILIFAIAVILLWKRR